MTWRDEALIARGHAEALSAVLDLIPREQLFANVTILRDELERRLQDAMESLRAPDSGSSLSKAAARNLGLRVGSLRHQALSCYLAAPLTDEECGEAMGHPRIWPRCSELRTMGLIRETGEVRRVERTGQDCEVCEITPAGRAMLANHNGSPE